MRYTGYSSFYHPHHNHHQTKRLPYATIALSNITYINPEAPLYLEGQVMDDTALLLHQLQKDQSPISFKFSTIAWDKTSVTWYTRFQSGYPEPADIRGIVQSISLQGNNRVALQMEPEPGMRQSLGLVDSASQKRVRLDWGNSSFKRRRKTMDDTAALHQIIMSDVLF